MIDDLDRELRDTFRRHEADLLGRGLTPPPNIDRRVRRQQARTVVITLVAASAVAIIGFIGLGAISASQGRPGDEIGPPTPSPTEEPTPVGGIDWAGVPGVSIDGDAFVDIETGEVTPLPNSITRFGDAGGYAIAPGGELLLFEAHVDGGTGNQIFVASVDGKDLRLLTDAKGGADAGGWSPDGTKIVARTWSQAGPGEDGGHVDLVVFDVATGDTTVLAEGPDHDFWDPHFSADGRQVLFGRFADQGSHTFGIPIEGGDASLVIEDRWNAIFSPDGRTIVYTASAQDGNTGGPELWLADADGSHPRPLVPDDEPFSDIASWSPDGTRILYTKLRTDADELVAVVDVASGAPTFSVHAPDLVGGVWLDGDTLIVDVGASGA